MRGREEKRKNHILSDERERRGRIVFLVMSVREREEEESYIKLSVREREREAEESYL